MKELLKLIPPKFRRRGIGVACSLFVKAGLNLIGLAMLLPVLALALDPASLSGDGWMAACYRMSGCHSAEQFAWLTAGMIVGIVAVKCLMTFLLSRIERRYIYDLYTALSRRLYAIYHQRGLPFIKRQNSAVLARNVNVVCLSFTAGVLKPAATILSEVLLLILIFGALALVAPWASLLTAFIFLPSMWGYYRYVRQRINRYGEEENRAQREKSRVVAETFRGFTDVELNNAFPMMLRRFDEAMHEVVRTRSREADIALLPQMVTELGLAIGIALLAALSLTLGLGDGASQLIFGIFAVAAIRLMPSVRNILSSWTTIRYNRYTIGILKEAPTEELQAQPSEEIDPLPFAHAITVSDLRFRFWDGEEELFDGLNLTIRKGEHIGFRGVSGVGKTTLFNLLLGFYTPTEGEIRIDGELLNDSTRKRWQQRVGYVSQSLFLTDGTFAENVALGTPSPEIDRGRVMQVLEMAQLGDFVRGLKQGVDTRIGECGCRLSGGQRQRIGIARALYRKADVLFFDEATSSLDAATEQEINHSIARLATEDKSLTLLVIAHRETSLEGCDRIITLDPPTHHG